MSQVTGKVIDTRLLGRLLKLAAPYRATFILAAFFTIFLSAISLSQPLLMEKAIDSYILADDFEGLTFIIILMIVLLLVQTLVQYFQTYSTNSIGQSVIRDLRIKVFNHITALRLSYFDRTPIGMLITRTVSDLETIADIFSEGLISILGDLLLVIGIVIFMAVKDWKLTLVVLVPLPLLILATYIFQEAIKSSFQEVRTQVARLNTFLQEHITGMAIIQYFAREKQEMLRFNEVNQKHRDAHIRSNWYYSIFFPVVELISALSMGLLVWYGSGRILSDQQLAELSVSAKGVTPGLVISFIALTNMLFRPIRQMADKFNTLQMGMVGADRIFQVLDTNEFTSSEGHLQPATIRGEIRFNGVWFAYPTAPKEGETPPDTDKWVLKDVNFHISPGETLALVGATGAGKSSVINILNRFYEIGRGHITLDGIDIREYELNFLRSRIGTVIQDVFLFSDTVAGNISLNNPAISREKMIAAAKEVGAHEFIERLPGGYDYEVMERGATLSTGQAQLISFIRALVNDPEILVLDEATSSVDTETELLIRNAISKLLTGRTSIVIAHRLSTIQNAHRILVLDKGEIREAGTHQELLQMNGYYKRLYDLQFTTAGINK
ncbi:ABC transporter ATP-binding protein [Hufsiella ginkgonis]|uniref:ATP-binding cassette domain-containing protein n=1 Tax=Hufsiella ginkgonis TaxID=2695274 RepID=A0A7K1XY03_9SPHI|nr:ABC transporter ATP-binding protein [Hufsiella ginkgonis]MXV15885.1 ATP-binding cassette domain-containing protein [Hufsiella ginkgonis]